MREANMKRKFKIGDLIQAVTWVPEFPMLIVDVDAVWHTYDVLFGEVVGRHSQEWLESNYEKLA